MSKIRLYGATSGYLELKAPAVSPDAEVEIPASFGPYGKVLQVVNVVKNDTFETTSTSYVDVTGLVASITPSANANKVLIVASVPYSYADGGGGAANTGYLSLARGATNLSVPTSFSARVPSLLAEAGNTQDGDMLNFSYSFLDSPNTTSSTSYSVIARVQTGTIRVNRARTDTDNNTKPRGVSSLTLFEIGA